MLQISWLFEGLSFPKISLLCGVRYLDGAYADYLTAFICVLEDTEMKHLLHSELSHQWHGNADTGSPPIVRGQAVIEGLCSTSLLQSLCGVSWRGERLDVEGPPFCLVDAVWSTYPVSQEIMPGNNGATRKHKKRTEDGGSTVGRLHWLQLGTSPSLIAYRIRPSTACNGERNIYCWMLRRVQW